MNLSDISFVNVFVQNKWLSRKIRDTRTIHFFKKEIWMKDVSKRILYIQHKFRITWKVGDAFRHFFHSTMVARCYIFIPKISIWVHFVLEWKMLLYVMAIWNILREFTYIVYFVAIWYILWLFGIFFPFWHFVPREIWQPCTAHQVLSQR
jgi:hypothetical protein